MSRGLEQTFFPRRHTNGQQVYETVLNITNHQGNQIDTTNNHPINITSHVSEWLSSQKARNNKCCLGCGEKGTLVHCSMVQPPWKTVGRLLKKLNKEVSYDLAILLLGIYLKKMETLIQKDISIPVFTSALFTIAKIWKQPKCPSIDEWIKRYDYTHTHTHTRWNITQP